MNIPDHFSESLETVFRVKNTILKLFDADLDTRSGMEKIGIRDKHPISATLSRIKKSKIFSTKMCLFYLMFFKEE
jgi:hypothetical protein